MQREKGFVVETLGYSETSSTFVDAEASGSGAWEQAGPTMWVWVLHPSLINSALPSSQQLLHKFTEWILLSLYSSRVMR